MRAWILVVLVAVCAGCAGGLTLQKHGTTDRDAYEAFERGRMAQDADQAIHWYSTAVQSDPGYVWAYNNRGLARYRKGDHDGAIADYSRAVELDPEFMLAYSNRRLAYLDKGLEAEAEQDHKRTLELKAKYCDPHNERGREFLEDRDFNSAIRELLKATMKCPPDAAPYYNLGLAYAGKNDFGRAVPQFSQAILLDPEWVHQAYHMRGVAYAALGHVEEAFGDLGKAIELKPDYGDAYHVRAALYCDKGQYEKARADVEKCGELGVEVQPAILEALKKAEAR